VCVRGGGVVSLISSRSSSTIAPGDHENSAGCAVGLPSGTGAGEARPHEDRRAGGGLALAGKLVGLALAVSRRRQHTDMLHEAEARGYRARIMACYDRCSACILNFEIT
jgi:hypothetical protein